MGRLWQLLSKWAHWCSPALARVPWQRAQAPSGHARGVSGTVAHNEETRASSVSFADAVRPTRKERNRGTSVIFTVSANSVFWCGDCQGVPREAQYDVVFLLEECTQLLHLHHQVQDRTNEREVRQQSSGYARQPRLRKS